MQCEECIHKAVCYRVDSVKNDHAQKCGDFVSGCKALEQDYDVECSNHSVLQEIRAELTKNYVDPYNRNAFRYATVSLLDVLDLIDKHIKEYTE